MNSLQGITVVDFGWNLPGPLVSKRLLDAGAKVIKIEPPSGDPAANLFLDSTGTPALYATLNSGKCIRRLDLKTASGNEEAKRLCLKADIVIEAFIPGAMERLGMSYQALREANPQLIYCSISAYGQVNRPGI